MQCIPKNDISLEKARKEACAIKGKTSDSATELATYCVIWGV